MELEILTSGERLDVAQLQAIDLAGACAYRDERGRLLAPAFRGFAVDMGAGPVPDPDDEVAFSDFVLRWVEQVRQRDWSDLRGAPLEGDGDWVDLRTAMTRTGWGPDAAQRAWASCRERPYARDLPTAAGWAAAGWVVPATPDAPDPVFARPVLEARGLLRWTYIDRWREGFDVPDGAMPTDPEPTAPAWAETLSRLRQDHYTDQSLSLAEDLAVAVLQQAGLGPRSPIEAEDDPLPDRDVATGCTHPSPLVRTAAWFLLQDEAERWMACGYAECQHHWAIEAEEDAYELEEVLELASHGVSNPVDAAYQRRRLLTLAFGDVSDVPLAGAGDVEDFIAFYEGWVRAGRPEDDFQAAARELRGDD